MLVVGVGRGVGVCAAVRLFACEQFAACRVAVVRGNVHGCGRRCGRFLCHHIAVLVVGGGLRYAVVVGGGCG